MSTPDEKTDPPADAGEVVVEPGEIATFPDGSVVVGAPTVFVVAPEMKVGE